MWVTRWPAITVLPRRPGSGGTGPVAGTVVEHGQPDAFVERVDEADLRDRDRADLHDRHVGIRIRRRVLGHRQRGRRGRRLGARRRRRGLRRGGRRPRSGRTGCAVATRRGDDRRAGHHDRRDRDREHDHETATVHRDHDITMRLRPSAPSIAYRSIAWSARASGSAPGFTSPSSASTCSTLASTAGRGSISAIARFGSLRPWPVTVHTTTSSRAIRP